MYKLHFSFTFELILILEFLFLYRLGLGVFSFLICDHNKYYDKSNHFGFAESIRWLLCQLRKSYAYLQREFGKIQKSLVPVYSQTWRQKNAQKTYHEVFQIIAASFRWFSQNFIYLIIIYLGYQNLEEEYDFIYKEIMQMNLKK